MKIYLAGPMRGHLLYNFPAFFKAALHLRKRGFDVVNPAEHDMAAGLNPDKPLDDKSQPPLFLNMREVLRQDFLEILNADGIVLLPGWDKSVGARAERLVAHHAGRKIFLWDPEERVALPVPADTQDPDIKFYLNGVQ